jgi:hypothetical protein
MAVAVTLTLGASAAMGASDGPPKDWQFGVSLYGWFPSVSGDLKFSPPGGSDDITADASDILDALQFTFMGSFEARKGPWSGFTDLIYLDLSGDGAKSVTSGSGASRTLFDGDLNLKGWIWTLGGSYSVWRERGSQLDLLAGARLLSLDIDLDMTGGGPLQRDRGLSQSVDLWDGIIGAKGRVALNERWFLPYYFDVGTGDSDITWQATAGVGYAFDWGEVNLMYRHLAYDQSDNKPLQDIAFSGFKLGVGFRF